MPPDVVVIAKPIPSATEVWLKGLASAVITSISTGCLSTIGTNLAGVNIQWQQLLLSSLCAGLVGAAAYLKQSPLPQ